MRVTGQPGYVLHARDWRETSLIVECLVRDHGRVGLIARGARRPRSRLPRALLQPFQPLSLGFSGQGELLNLGAVEPAGASVALQPTAVLAGLYVNELLVRLLPRQDAHPALLSRYALLLQQLIEPTDVGWMLRRFERDLLAELGYGLALTTDADSGAAIDADGEYAYIADAGPVVAGAQHGLRLRGADMLAFAADRVPSPAGKLAIRRMLRDVIRHHLGGAELRSPSVLGAAMRASASAGNTGS